MDELKEMMKCLIQQAHQQLSENKQTVCTEQLGEVVDMIKDLTQAMYYWTITEAMIKKDEAIQAESTIAK